MLTPSPESLEEARKLVARHAPQAVPLPMGPSTIAYCPACLGWYVTSLSHDCPAGRPSLAEDIALALDRQAERGRREAAERARKAFDTVDIGAVRQGVEIVIAAILSSPAPEKPAPADAWNIWSKYHHAWWRPNACGYTTAREGAGVYAKEQADKHCRQRTGPDEPYEIAVRVGEEFSSPAPGGEIL